MNEELEKTCNKRTNFKDVPEGPEENHETHELEERPIQNFSART
jgi:hypothetical protein